MSPARWVETADSNLNGHIAQHRFSIGRLEFRTLLSKSVLPAVSWRAFPRSLKRWSYAPRSFSTVPASDSIPRRARIRQKRRWQSPRARPARMAAAYAPLLRIGGTSRTVHCEPSEIILRHRFGGTLASVLHPAGTSKVNCTCMNQDVFLEKPLQLVDPAFACGLRIQSRPRSQHYFMVRLRSGCDNWSETPPCKDCVSRNSLSLTSYSVPQPCPHSTACTDTSFCRPRRLTAKIISVAAFAAEDSHHAAMVLDVVTLTDHVVIGGWGQYNRIRYRDGPAARG